MYLYCVMSIEHVAMPAHVISVCCDCAPVCTPVFLAALQQLCPGSNLASTAAVLGLSTIGGTSQAVAGPICALFGGRGHIKSGARKQEVKILKSKFSEDHVGDGTT